jgi:hypothetical protein
VRPDAVREVSLPERLLRSVSLLEGVSTLVGARVPSTHRRSPEGGLTESWCRRADLNRGPTDYESVALPLSYVGAPRS